LLFIPFVLFCFFFWQYWGFELRPHAC
jgi:hypothetical protein